EPADPHQGFDDDVRCGLGPGHLVAANDRAEELGEAHRVQQGACPLTGLAGGHTQAHATSTQTGQHVDDPGKDADLVRELVAGPHEGPFQFERQPHAAHDVREVAAQVGAVLGERGLTRPHHLVVGVGERLAHHREAVDEYAVQIEYHDRVRA